MNVTANPLRVGLIGLTRDGWHLIERSLAGRPFRVAAAYDVASLEAPPPARWNIPLVSSLGRKQKQVCDLEPRPSGSGSDSPLPDGRGSRTLFLNELKARIKELKADIKVLNSKIAEKAYLAQTVRDQIEPWRSQEPSTWGDWLAEQPLFDQISSLDHRRPVPTTIAEFIAQESLYAPDINDGVRVNIVPLQKAGLLAADVIAAKDLDKAIADRAEWRSDERRWVREGKLPQPGWWPEAGE